MLAAAMRDLADAGAEAQRSRNHRELAIFEKDFDKIAVLVDGLVAGNYADTAARLAGINPSSVRRWIAEAEKGDERFQRVAAVIHLGAAMAESEAVGHVRAAGKEPRNWAASMTFLERRYPGKWGRRPEDTEAPRVVVQIGVGPQDVRVLLESPTKATAD